MDLMQAIEARHSVRSYTDQPIEQEKRDELQQLVTELNADADLSMQLAFDEPNAFDSSMARYGTFQGVRNYLALVGPKDPALEEVCGFFGEWVVLRAQQLGLNSCWVGLTYSKKKTVAEVLPDQKLVCVVALGYGETQGKPRKSRSFQRVADVKTPETPTWFIDGVNAALLAPTAMNQQRFHFTLEAPDVVSATAGNGYYTKLDLGIAQYHFMVGAGAENFRWA